MKELDYHPNFWSNVYWDFLDFPKKIWGLRAPPTICTGTPKMPYFRYLGVLVQIAGGALRPQIFLGKSRKSQ